MPRPRKPSAKTKSTGKLLEALKFLSCVTKDIGAPFETHIALWNKTARAANGVLAAGAFIDEELVAAPHNTTLLNALSKCGEQFALTELDSSRLSIKSDKFKAVIPCIDMALLSFVEPDLPCASIDDRFKDAITAAGLIATESNAQKVYLLSFLLNGQSVISTDGRIILEYWHGIDLPVGLPIPKSVIPAIVQNPKKLAKFGFSNSSATFFFEDDSWIKTQLYADAWPNTVFDFLNRASNPYPVPKDFYEGLNAVAPFVEKDNVYFDREKLCSHNVEGLGATYDVAGLPKGPIYSIKYLQMIKNYVETIDFVIPNDRGTYMAMFFGKSIRGMIAGYG